MLATLLTFPGTFVLGYISRVWWYMLDLLENPNSLLYLLLPLCVCALVAYVLLPLCCCPVMTSKVWGSPLPWIFTSSTFVPFELLNAFFGTILNSYCLGDSYYCLMMNLRFWRTWGLVWICRFCVFWWFLWGFDFVYQVCVFLKVETGCSFLMSYVVLLDKVRGWCWQ